MGWYEYEKILNQKKEREDMDDNNSGSSKNEDLTPGTHKIRIKEAMDRLFEKQEAKKPRTLDGMSAEDAISGAILGAKVICGDESLAEELKEKAESLVLTKEQDIEFKLANYVAQNVDVAPAKQIADGIGLEWTEKVEVIHRTAVMGGAANMYWTLKAMGCLKPEFLEKISEMYDAGEAEQKKGGSSGWGK